MNFGTIQNLFKQLLRVLISVSYTIVIDKANIIKLKHIKTMAEIKSIIVKHWQTMFNYIAIIAIVCLVHISYK